MAARNPQPEARRYSGLEMVNFVGAAYIMRQTEQVGVGVYLFDNTRALALRSPVSQFLCYPVLGSLRVEGQMQPLRNTICAMRRSPVMQADICKVKPAAVDGSCVEAVIVVPASCSSVRFYNCDALVWCTEAPEIMHQDSIVYAGVI